MQNFLRILPLLLIAGCNSATVSHGGDARLASTSPHTSAATVGTGSRLSNEEVNVILSEHNRVRADVGVAPLRWSGGLAQVAQKWADHLAASSCSLTHSRGSGYGENLFMGTSGYYGVKEAVRAWESEKKYYHGGKISRNNGHATGHYTQIVWRNTQGVGCAQSNCKGQTIVVCNYNPPGNYMGKSPY